MIRIALCVRDPAVGEEWKTFVARYVTEKETECLLTTFSTGEAFLEKLNDFDVAFIAACREENADMAEKVREQNPTMPLVFLLGAEPFAVKGKTVDAMDFLPRPVTYYAFSTMLDRIQTRLVKSEVPTIALMTKQGAKRISVDDITYIESSGLNVVYHLTNGDERIRGSLNDAAKKLTADRFFRLNGYLLHLKHIHRVVGSDVYVGDACLPLPLHKKAELLESLLAFMNRG